MLLECCFATRRSSSHTSVWKTCRKRFRSTGWTATQWPPPRPLPSCCWSPQRRWQRSGSSTRPRRSCWIMHGDATRLWMRRHSAGCRPWRRITCCCPSPTGSDTEGGGTLRLWTTVCLLGCGIRTEDQCSAASSQPPVLIDEETNFSAASQSWIWLFPQKTVNVSPSAASLTSKNPQ